MVSLPLPPARDGLLTYADARAVGLLHTDLAALVRAGELVRLRRGVYTSAELWAALDPHREQPLLRVRAALRVLRCRDYVLSHDSAALFLGMGVPDPANALVHVTRRKVHGDADRTGIKHHLAPWKPEQVQVVDGLPTLDLARTALDMAREHGLVAGVACLDHALRRGVTRGALARAREAMHCWPGSRVMDRALALADPGAESWLESEARVLVHGLGIGTPETQFGLCAGGRTVWCDLRIGRHVFEVDGLVKYGRDNLKGEPGSEVLWAEKRRQDFVSGFKLGVSRITLRDCRGGRREAEARLRREFADTCARFGTDISDLQRYVVRRRR